MALIRQITDLQFAARPDWVGEYGEDEVVVVVFKVVGVGVITMEDEVVLLVGGGVYGTTDPYTQ
jgi:hypothetical protein